MLTGNITTGENRKKFTVPPQKVTVGSENGKIFWYISATGLLKAEVEDLETLKEAIDAAPADDKPFIIKLAGTIDDLQTVQIPGHKKIMLKADTAVTLTCPQKWNDYKHLHVKEHASLTLKGLIKLQGAAYGRNSQYALYVETGGTAEIKNGVTITEFKNSWFTNGGDHDGKCPVFVDGTLTMSGGTITKNKANTDGKAVMLQHYFNWAGGEIKDNQEGSGSVIGDSGGYFQNNCHGTAT
ncbi:hypothetical protein [Treponema sp. OMZ 857]|uniref:hypothetical protein n=1 Tax=Treponema sp. OMZ 857 TaxID=1643513 RepID=UPI0020A4731B|nr:hypothetical protein [Treponema sp. OMZ 857]UTC43587.1 hypothetical protein E4N66_05595 [Treponema sp. OMZ 857]